MVPVPDAEGGGVGRCPRAILAIDQGTTSTRAIVFDGAMTAARHRAAGIPADLSGARLGRARSGGDLVERGCDRAGGARASRACARRTSPRSASPISARPRVIWDRATGKPIHNAIVWQDRRTDDSLRGACAQPAMKPTIAARTGLLLDPYFSATKIAWLLDHVDGARASGGGGPARLRHHRQLPDLAADRRQGARDRRHQRRAHAAVRHPHRAMGRGTCADCSACRWRCCRRCATAPHDFGTTDYPGRRDPDPRRRRRSAGGDRRAGLFHARHDEIDLWHRLLRAAQHRRAAR